jgi:hypothetical protein
MTKNGCCLTFDRILVMEEVRNAGVSQTLFIKRNVGATPIKSGFSTGVGRPLIIYLWELGLAAVSSMKILLAICIYPD